MTGSPVEPLSILSCSLSDGLSSVFLTAHFSFSMKMSEMNSMDQDMSQSQQAAPVEVTGISRAKLHSLQPEQRQAFYRQTLVQGKTIRISPNGTFSRLDEPAPSSWHLTISQNAEDILALEAAGVFYSSNQFAIHINSCPQFMSWNLANYKISDLITVL